MSRVSYVSNLPYGQQSPVHVNASGILNPNNGKNNNENYYEPSNDTSVDVGQLVFRKKSEYFSEYDEAEYITMLNGEKKYSPEIFDKKYAFFGAIPVPFSPYDGTDRNFNGKKRAFTVQVSGGFSVVLSSRHNIFIGDLLKAVAPDDMTPKPKRGEIDSKRYIPMVEPIRPGSILTSFTEVATNINDKRIKEKAPFQCNEEYEQNVLDPELINSSRIRNSILSLAFGMITKLCRDGHLQIVTKKDRAEYTKVIQDVTNKKEFFSKSYDGNAFVLEDSPLKGDATTPEDIKEEMNRITEDRLTYLGSLLGLGGVSSDNIFNDELVYELMQSFVGPMSSNITKNDSMLGKPSKGDGDVTAEIKKMIRSAQYNAPSDLLSAVIDHTDEYRTNNIVGEALENYNGGDPFSQNVLLNLSKH